MPTKNKIVSLALPDEQIAQIEEYWRHNNFPNRTQGMIDLMRKGVAALQEKAAEAQPVDQQKDLLISIYESLDEKDQADLIHLGELMQLQKKYK